MLTYEIKDQGGNFIRAFSLAKNLVKLNHKVTLLTGNPTINLHYKSSIIDGVKLIEVPDIFPKRLRHDGWSPMQIFFRCVYVLTHRFDLVHGFGHRPSVIIPCLLYRLLYKKPYVADWADLWGLGGIATLRHKFIGKIEGFIDDILEKFTYKSVNGISVINTYLQKKAVNLRKSSDNLLLQVGSDIEVIKPLNKNLMRKKYGFSLHIPILIHLGNASYDAEFLAKTFIELKKINQKVIMLHIGKYMYEFENLINQSGFGNAVINKGFVSHDHIQELLACGDVMCLPYTHKTINLGRYPNKIGDYLAAGKPIVTNPTGDMKNLFNKTKIGILVKESPIKMAKAINQLLKNKRLQYQYGKNARKLAEDNLSWLKLSKNLQKYYLSVLSKKLS